MSAGIQFNYGGNNCTSASPWPGYVDVIYDPNCPTGCKVLAD